MNSISNSYPNLQLPATNLQSSTTQQGENASFKNFLLDSIQEVNSMQQEADQAVEAMMTGTGEANPAEVLTAVQKADMSFRLMMQMRNKMMQVYQEVRDIRI